MKKHAIISIATVAMATTIAFAQDSGEGTTATVTIQEVVLSKALEEGTPVEPGTSFAQSDGRVYATVRVENPSREATSIRVALRRADQEAGGHGIELEVPARPRYRTVARFTTRRAPGSYRVIVFAADGSELSSTTLTITE